MTLQKSCTDSFPCRLRSWNVSRQPNVKALRGCSSEVGNHPECRSCMHIWGWPGQWQNDTGNMWIPDMSMTVKSLIGGLGHGHTPTSWPNMILKPRSCNCMSSKYAPVHLLTSGKYKMIKQRNNSLQVASEREDASVPEQCTLCNLNGYQNNLNSEWFLAELSNLCTIVQHRCPGCLCVAARQHIVGGTWASPDTDEAIIQC